MSDNDDLRTLTILERWKETAVHQVDDIGAWRDANKDQLTRYHWGEPQHFYADTVAICERITTEYKQFDASPLQSVCSAVCSWHESRSANGLPTQQVSFSL